MSFLVPSYIDPTDADTPIEGAYAYINFEALQFDIDPQGQQTVRGRVELRVCRNPAAASRFGDQPVGSESFPLDDSDMADLLSDPETAQAFAIFRQWLYNRARARVPAFAEAVDVE